MRKILIILFVIFLVVPTLAIANDLFIRETNGKRIVLSDGSEWFVHQSDQGYSPLWILRERVTVQPARSPQGNYEYVLMRNNGTSEILVQYSNSPMQYRSYTRHTQSVLPHLYRQQQRIDNRMNNLLNLFLISKQLQARREQRERYQEEQDEEKQYQKKPQPKKRLIGIHESDVAYISIERNLFHKEATCPFLKRDCRSFQLNPRAMSVKKARKLGCTPCSHCFGEKKKP